MHKTKSGFTIVELLVVIVVIGILAAITIVSYSGVTNRANIASLQAELSISSKKMDIYYSLNGTYPSAIDLATGCPTAPVVDLSNCVKFSSSTTYVYTQNSDTSYKLVATRGMNVYKISENSSPVIASSVSITGIAPIIGTVASGELLTAGALTPAEATATYQWQISTTPGGVYTNISGATSPTYIPVSADETRYLKVVATGSGDYSGTVTSVNSSQIATGSWLVIGSQIWAKSNLNVGTMINGGSSQTNNAVLEKYCYGNSETNCTNDGALYKWDEAMQYSTNEGAQGICPTGSRIPTDNDWKILEMYLGMTQPQTEGTGWRGTDQGTKLKVSGSSGVNIPLGGYLTTTNTFGERGTAMDFWSSSNSGGSAWSRGFFASYATVSRSLDSKAYGFAVRCLRN